MGRVSWALRLRWLEAVRLEEPRVLDTLRELLPDEPFRLRSFRASRVCRDYLLDEPVEDQERLQLARGEWLTLLTRWAARWRLGRIPWVLEAAEETLEIRRLALLGGWPEEPRWWPGEAVATDVSRVPDQAMRWHARYHVLGEPVAVLAAASRADWRTVRTSLQEAAAALGLELRPPDRGGRGAPDRRQLRIEAVAPKLVRVPVKGVIR
jgi:hypothetical protein